MVSKRNMIAADVRARDLEQMAFIKEHTTRVVGYIHFHADGTVEFASLGDRISGVRFIRPVKVHSV